MSRIKTDHKLESIVSYEDLARNIMTDESLKLRSSIAEIFHELSEGNDLSGFAFFVFGSPSRNELVYCGDIDGFLISPDDLDSQRIREEIIQRIDNLGYDKVDVPPWNSLEEVLLTSNLNNPEGDYADADFVGGDIEVLKQYMQLGIKEKFLTSDHIVPKLLFHYYFWNHKYNRSSNSRGRNLKYSHGATRDMLFIDWYYDLLAGEKARSEVVKGSPQIYLALDYFVQTGFISKEELDELSGAIGFINLIKSLSLQLIVGTEEEGEAYLNDNTALGLIESYQQYLSQYDSSKQLQVNYNEARLKVFRLKQRIHQQLLGNLTNYLSEQEVEEFTFMRDLWELPTMNLDELCLNEFSDKFSWYIWASLLCRQDLGADLIDKLANELKYIPGFNYLCRYIVKHPNTSVKTLETLLNLPRLALAPETDIKYRNLILKRINYE